MKKLLVAFLLMLSVGVYSQINEYTYIYKYVSIFKDGAVNTYKSPSRLTYFYTGEGLIKVEVAGMVHIYEIVSTPEKKYISNIPYYDMVVNDGSADMSCRIYERVEYYGASFADTKVSIRYHNDEN